MLKTILIILILAMIGSLTGAMRNLFKESEDSNNNQTRKWLTIRVIIAVLILLVVTVGALTGEFTMSAPWSGQY